MDTNEPPTTEVDWNEKSLHPPIPASPDILDLENMNNREIIDRAQAGS